MSNEAGLQKLDKYFRDVTNDIEFQKGIVITLSANFDKLLVEWIEEFSKNKSSAEECIRFKNDLYELLVAEVDVYGSLAGNQRLWLIERIDIIGQK